METDLISKLAETEAYIRSRTKVTPEIAIILGSGLGELAETSTEDLVFNYGELPYYSPSTVEGHAGRLIIGSLAGKSVAVMQGRTHYYEGYGMNEVIYPVRLLKTLGVKHLIITSACGALNPQYRLHDIVLIKDHINLMGANPLAGPYYSEFGPRFPDVSGLYNLELRKKARAAARKNGIRVREGVYLAVSGPTYETPAEIKAFRKLGGDLVGMSMAPEALAAGQMGMNVAGIAYVSNALKRSKNKELTHEDVIKAGKAVSRGIGKLIADIVCEI